MNSMTLGLSGQAKLPTLQTSPVLLVESLGAAMNFRVDKPRIKLGDSLPVELGSLTVKIQHHIQGCQGLKSAITTGSSPYYVII